MTTFIFKVQLPSCGCYSIVCFVRKYISITFEYTQQYYFAIHKREKLSMYLLVRNSFCFSCHLPVFYTGVELLKVFSLSTNVQCQSSSLHFFILLGITTMFLICLIGFCHCLLVWSSFVEFLLLSNTN